MTEFRVKAYQRFEQMPMPEWGPDLSEIDFQDFTYYKRVSQEAERSWEDVPEEVKNTFEKLGIPEAERKYLAGVTTQYESEAVYHNMLEEVQSKVDNDNVGGKHILIICPFIKSRQHFFRLSHKKFRVGNPVA